MKRIFLIVLFVGLLFSCSDDEKEQLFVAEIIGSWDWVESTGGIDGRTETPASTGNEIVVEFWGASYKKYVNDELVEEMTYKLEEGESMIFGKKTVQIIYQNGWKQSIERCDTKLILHDECSDCFRNEYNRK
ncbi:hypothetical protein DWB61_12530 [Ancylomarina euxinus]|uniref:Lipocalin-like domain-containing protein n=1 Tax=Ancylomarina euxinus TaxID=2283627 RepID=A0A425XZ36_9BACT|nr:hypothetical protein [Ancylomarina euxinus]MCZ4695544.1 hypothetical protein [Ancylomarina euxinus]MUP15925.1 hypothetical protein [Ancylomarina euxinus]RRG20366.1 hypothetical protein DWB61_12530 [Ancylomarina euxinus]